ncbi:MAG: flagellar motor switch protein FliG [Candidatus Dadabacteria bacterium]|nr:MAG: flagellar motor switch protein FliG [Candidatus Dadabacteria bacterium]
MPPGTHHKYWEKNKVLPAAILSGTDTMARGGRYSNTEKAAITLLSLGKDVASEVLQHLSEQEVKRISRAFMAVSEVDRETQFEVANEFRTMINAGNKVLVDGREFAKDVIAEAFGETAGEGLLEYITGARKEPISQIIQDVPEKILNSFIAAEHPQTVSFLMTKMNPDQAAAVLQTMPEEAQTDILIRIANLNNVKADVVDEVREVLRAQLRGSGANEEEVVGPKSAADILNFVDRTNEERILTEIEEMYPDMAEQIRNLMFTFEDCKKIDDKGIQTVLKEVPRDQLVLSLKTASDELKDLLFRNVSQRAAQMIQEDLEALGPVKLKDVEKAQQGIVDIVRRLEAEGKIVIGGSGADEMLV